MEGELWPQVYRLLHEESNKRPRRRHVQFSDARILEVFFWAAIHDRPTTWACDIRNWPESERWQDLPCDSTMSDRLRTLAVCQLMQALLDHLRQCTDMQALVRRLDSKPLAVGCYSKDADARWGYAAKAQARGYKIFSVWSTGLTPDAWTVGPMNEADCEAGVHLLPQLTGAAYLLGDAGHDSNRLYAACAGMGCQLVTPRKKPRTELGHHPQEPSRLRSIEMLEWPVTRGYSPSPFARQLYAMRGQIERDYGNLCTFGGGLQPLPSWVRTPHRVALWIAAKLVINALRKCKNAGLTP